MRVRNMTSANGTTVPNQFVIEDGTRTVFQSYGTIIATIDEGPSSAAVTLDTRALDYSQTTSKYLYRFLGGLTRREVQDRIKREEYAVADLNP